MRKFVPFIALAICVNLSISCETENSNANSELKISGITKSRTTDEYRLRFEMLSNEAKAELWKERLTSLSQSSNLSSAQKSLIASALPEINPSIWEKSSTKRAAFKALFLPKFSANAKRLFTKRQLTEYFTIGFEMKPPISQPIFCDCYEGEIGDFDCGLFSGTCYKRRTCDDDTSYSCGTFNTSECDGECRT